MIQPPDPQLAEIEKQLDLLLEFVELKLSWAHYSDIGAQDLQRKIHLYLADKNHNSD